MTSVDELFKKPLPAGSSKRKFEPVQDPNELYKAAKLDSNGDVRTKGKSAMVEDEFDDDDGEAGPELPPDFEEDIPDDEEGRFFGGGMEQKTAQAMQYIDQNEEEEAAPEKFDAAWVRRFALNFEKKISKNAELRAKFENDPAKFMASEADLDTEIKGLSILSENPELYEEFSKMGCVASLVSLLSHENADIAIDAIQIISELTDEDVEAEQEQWDSLVNAMMDSDLIELLTQNLSRLDEGAETDRTGIYYILSVLENLSSQSALAEKIGEDAAVLPWILSRIQQKETPVSQNKQYAAEILAILLQSSPKNREKFVALDGVDALLQLLSQYRKRDPAKDSEEEEYVENLFDSLACLVDDDAGKEKFIDAEGIELAQIMLRESKFSKPRALKILDHALGGSGGGPAQAINFHPWHTLHMTNIKQQEGQNIEHLLGIFASLLRLLPGGSAPRIRALAKFMEKEYEKIEKLIKLRRDYAARVSPVEQAIEKERKGLSQDDQEFMAGEWLSRRFDAGLFSLQTIDVILAWLVAEDDGAKKKVVSLLADRDEDLSLVRSTLQEQLEGLGDEDQGQKDFKDMLSTLLQFV
ncbi:Beta-catenin-like protein 1 [Penicillium cataractarum]|uniref:Beta-catenin-like protein 1 n=1 Tax=Penicillium cataractarum TaxID=2100454 RepID=A0A9W9VU35_9EURO|nr:Beta-catenin-like protein 1 [Penicillium cataractarum]KAJ5389159.1 Beta-catenin-like protein 1 [Penicillium cataractarum]